MLRAVSMAALAFSGAISQTQAALPTKQQDSIENTCPATDLCDNDRLLKFMKPDICPVEVAQPYEVVSGTVNETHFDMQKPDFVKAANHGFFKVPMTEDLKQHAAVLKRFSQEFYKEKKNDGTALDEYRGFNSKFNVEHPEIAASPVEGYMADNTHPLNETAAKNRQNQCIRFSLVDDNWKHYPKDVQNAFKAMNELGKKIWTFTLKQLGVPEALHEAASGGSTSDTGDVFGLVNFYDPSISEKGLNAHQDWSGLTVLLAPEQEKPSLQAYIEGQWEDISAKRDDAIINWGTTAEILTEKLDPDQQIKASVHRVVKQEGESRTSIAVFLDHGLMMPVFELDPETKNLTMRMPSFLKYVTDMTTKTYEGNNTEWS